MWNWIYASTVWKVNHSFALLWHLFLWFSGNLLQSCNSGWDTGETWLPAGLLGKEGKWLREVFHWKPKKKEGEALRLRGFHSTSNKCMKSAKAIHQQGEERCPLVCRSPSLICCLRGHMEAFIIIFPVGWRLYRQGRTITRREKITVTPSHLLHQQVPFHWIHNLEVRSGGSVRVLHTCMLEFPSASGHMEIYKLSAWTWSKTVTFRGQTGAEDWPTKALEWIAADVHMYRVQDFVRSAEGVRPLQDKFLGKNPAQPLKRRQDWRHTHEMYFCFLSCTVAISGNLNAHDDITCTNPAPQLNGSPHLNPIQFFWDEPEGRLQSHPWCLWGINTREKNVWELK